MDVILYLTFKSPFFQFDHFDILKEETVSYQKSLPSNVNVSTKLIANMN
jgi:hypothetical protein